MIGNNASINSLGFMSSNENPNISLSHIFTRIDRKKRNNKNSFTRNWKEKKYASNFS